ncbi:tautomerase family protein [Stenotrophomonas sp. ISL-67]|uniref:tautomerase family protein n=1 Tax=Stenotrophomonas sp. ISL-67 TaxID=2819171 RepID=UPI001BE6A65F|nr:tautomerase family protein [Stenotrophomonas sp. ISL-67]MBT2766844.1 tautomerase family protein [Stenotrophomonas sp. ISL-67]
MPIIQVTLVQGRDEQKVQNFIREVARAAHQQLDAPMHTIRVMVNEVSPQRFAVGDVLKSDPPAGEAA